MPRALAYIALLLGLAACYWPVHFQNAALAFAAAHGCKLTGITLYPCLVDGIDHGQRLFDAFNFGWMIMVTFGIGIAIVLALAAMAWSDLKRRLAR